MNTLLIIGIIILVLWLLGWLGIPGLGWIVHIALVVALILLIIWLLKKLKVF